MKQFFSFPNPVNDAAARTVAIGVVAMSVVAFLTNTSWILIPLTYGFLARVISGPKISPVRLSALLKALAPPSVSVHQLFV